MQSRKTSGRANDQLTIDAAQVTEFDAVVAESARRTGPACAPALKRLDHHADSGAHVIRGGMPEVFSNVLIDTGLGGIPHSSSPRRATPLSWPGFRTCATMTSAASTARSRTATAMPGGSAGHRPAAEPRGDREQRGRKRTAGVSAFKRRRITLPDGRAELRTVRPGFRRALAMLADGRADGLGVVDK